MTAPSPSWDFIIVGGGTAGCAVAAQLAADTRCTVLLIEAGALRSTLLSRVPLAFPLLASIRALNWQQVLDVRPAPDEGAPSLRMGKGVGGSSLINGMIWSRGHPADYDHWSALGARGWNFEEVLPWFRATEKHWSGSGHWHGSEGPVAVTRANGPFALGNPLRRAAGAVGIPSVDDLCHPPFEGIAAAEFAITGRGRRVSTDRAFLGGTRPWNLEISADSIVNEIVLEGGRAIGVKMKNRDGKTVTVKARREVILCAGAYHSPRILMQSGIGDPDVLRASGVRLQHALPGVGQNYQNHITITGFHEMGVARSFPERLRADRLVGAALSWAFGRAGTLGQIPLAQVAQYHSRKGLAQPDMQALYTEGSLFDRPWLPRWRHAKSYRMMITHTLLRPNARGRLRLNAPGAGRPLSLDFAITADRDDVQRLVDGLGIQRRITRMLERDGVLRNDSAALPDGDLEPFVKHHARLSQHAVGTCAMGRGDLAVVDERLRVWGIKGLRVIDASVAPEIPGANTYAMTVMIAMRGASFIASEHGFSLLNDGRGMQSHAPA